MVRPIEDEFISSENKICESCNGTGCTFCNYSGQEIGGLCPVSGIFCEEYKNCEEKNYCWLK